MKTKIIISEDQDSWSRAVVDSIVQKSRQAIAKRGFFTLVLSGGSTPAPVYTALGKRQSEIDWQHTYIFWGDERCVPPDHQECNFRSVNLTLFPQASIPQENIFRMQGEIAPEEAAKRYTELIEKFFGEREKKFDLILLGLGEDGHTASLFPNTPALTENSKWVVENQHPGSNQWRITLTYPALTSARDIYFLVKGENKADIVAEVLSNPNSPPEYPAKKLLQVKETSWYLDKKAAEKIIENPNMEIIQS